ncbi:hypothetical protein [Streptomyces himalayensis]|uniref:Uncharacterized protein n=1 Tax=Streptomyces himalayensis subsp. himalayensis TaxID=2756131 RepID=A0A7W0IDD2_9ACTN|nr:hypothetical protein [Streptomyces himalayensis]MBA2951139.1 hypothetical protein [Streptomyces himalayensis subsp. himalayensis]
MARRHLARTLFAMLYPHNLDLHAFRILLMDATGHASEEVTGFGEADVEFLPKGVRLTLLKNRAEHRTSPLPSRPFAPAVLGNATEPFTSHVTRKGRHGRRQMEQAMSR